jgi:CRISPR-associated protein Csm5
MNRTVHFQQFVLELEPLTPIHIGSGNSFEALDYAFRDKPEPHIVSLDTNRFLSEMNQQQREAFLRRVNAGAQLASWFRAQIQATKRYDRYTIAVEKQTAAELKRVVEDPQAEGEIHLLPRHAATAEVYLPGSSLKGALRTAIVAQRAQQPALQSQLAAVARDTKPHQGSARFEAVALGHAHDHGRPNLYRDPLRQVMLSDLRPVEGATQIFRIKIVRGHAEARTNAPDPGGIHIWRETTHATTLGQSGLFRGQLRLAPHLADPRCCGPDRDNKPTHVALPLPLDDILRACNDFYPKRLREELEHFACQPGVKDQLLKAVQDLKPRECLVRLGRHSHFECVTVGPPHWQPPRRGFGKTRSYAGGQVPMGWALLRFRPAFS